MSRSISCLVSALLFTCVATTAQAEDGWTSMFNGKTLAGWTQKNGTATYRVENGEIVGTTAKGSPNSFLGTVRNYRNFEMEFETKVDNRLNSGVQIRSQTDDKPGKNSVYNPGRVNGPQVEIEASGAAGAEAGYIYGEATGRGWLIPQDKLIPLKHFKDGEWNHYRIVAQGPRIQTFINGEPVADLTDEETYQKYSWGFIALQVHAIGQNEGPYEVRWRNLKIRDLETEELH
ncbi:3-keto-disaccharide hydrolase [Aeoliella mucimassa]|uniref:3-keto-alpha-glucoside-1,2-lyase/3-keto-2-hydroxy-glucal hydratase domain-containing protein n=1 Tax=Aeoliella mucimassa TaxID=2527972 RepID=A0A518AIR8_9BACT|nr:DUF1080 domain-containing protein [Aeoliella mucimassa]QDU54633.1 hypothetical protein Pan181_08160 [Aeoliella mucimassa]